MSLNGFILLLTILQLGQISCINLHLLALVPLVDTDKELSNCLDMGEELILAAEIAAGRINSNPNLLANFTLEIVPAGTDRCSDPSIAGALGSFVNFTSKQSLNIVGIIGLVCPSALLGLSHIASLPYVDILQISSSTTSPSIVTSIRSDTIGRLYQIAPSSTVFNEVVVALMKKHSWRKISVIRHTESISVEHDLLANDFQMKIEAVSGLNIGAYSETASGLKRFVQAVKLSGMRIVYASVIDSEARQLICLSYLNNVSWPNYLWIFHDHLLDNLIRNTMDCSMETMEMALEGVILLHHQVSGDNNTKIDHVNYTYGEYRTMYSEGLKNITSQPVCNKEPQILSANALHDSVIAFAYALNRSLALLENGISCLGTIGDRGCRTTESVSDNLQFSNFSGAGGEISFDNVTHQLVVNSRVSIHQVSKGVLSFLAHFDQGITESDAGPLNISYTFETKIIRLPLALPLSTLVVIGLCLIVTLITLIFFIAYRNSLNIKATSPLLSCTILFSCFLLYTSVGATAARHGFASGRAYANLCASEQFFFVLGVQLIFATLFVRLLRVARIFFKYTPIGEAWSDKVLALYIFAITLVTFFLLLVWLASGDFYARERVEFFPTANPPHFTVRLSCASKKQPIFLTLLWVYTGFIMLLVLFLAIKTRKISIDIFKDTKSVNAFIFCSVGVFALLVPLSYITAVFTATPAMILSYLFQVASVIVVATACVALLFLPKVYSALFTVPKPLSKSVGTSGVLSRSDDGFIQRTAGVKFSFSLP